MKFILPLFISVFITGCTITNINQPKKENTSPRVALEESQIEAFGIKDNITHENVHSKLNNTIIAIADQLFQTKIDKKNPTRVILTSFVDLNKLEKTSPFGRLITESMFNELHIRKFLVTDFRGREAVTVNEDGEFHITRDVDELKDNVDSVEYILVGTYVKFENQSLLVNARILDSLSGRILSSARVIYRPKDCALFGICMKKNIIETENSRTQKPVMTNKKIETKTPIMIIKDN